MQFPNLLKDVERYVVRFQFPETCWIPFFFWAALEEIQEVVGFGVYHDGIVKNTANKKWGSTQFR